MKTIRIFNKRFDGKVEDELVIQIVLVKTNMLYFLAESSKHIQRNY